MPEFVALFSFKRLNAEQYPEDQRYGEGSIKIDAEREPETTEDFTEIAKAIFRQGGYEEVAVNKVFYDDNNLFKNLDKPKDVRNEYTIDATGDTGILNDVIPGEIVDE